jgi:rubrerythrin
MNFESVEKILDFAIKKEEEAAQLYMDLAADLAPTHMKQVFESIAQEEKQHRAKLLEVKAGNQLLAAEEKVMDLKIGDYLPDVEAGPDLNYQQALILAMKAEKAAFKLYQDLAQTTEDRNLKALFLSLSQEEAKHKLRFEVEYDENILQEN